MTRPGLLFAAAAALLAGCLFDRPLISADNAYDPRLALVRDSLARFDTVEIRLVDPDDPSVSILLWKGPPGATDLLPLHLAGDGQTLVYLVQGYRIDRGGLCFTERVSREGKHSDRIDTCAVKPAIPDPKPDPKPGPLPRFLLDTLDFGKSDSSLILALADFPDTGKARYSVAHSEDWIALVPGKRDIGVRVDRSALAVGVHIGQVVLTAEFPDSKDTVIVLVTVPKPVADIRGTLVDWSDSLPQPGFTISLDGNAKKTFSDSDGSFSFPGVDLGPHVVTVTAQASSGRIGRVDTFTIAAAGSFPRIVAVAPARAFAAVNLGWNHVLGRTAIAGGYGLVLTHEIDQAGSVAAFPLDNPSSSLKKVFPLGNSDGDPDFPEFYEAGEVTADSQALFIAYPEAARIGRFGNWRTAPESLSVATPFRPGALLLRGPRLFALGRLDDNTLALGEWNAADLSQIRMDTLTGFHWDGTLPDRRTPKMAFWNGSIYAVDGNGPGEQGHILRIGTDSFQVIGSKQLPDAILTGLAIHDGMIYVTAMSSTGKAILILDPGLNQKSSIAAGLNTGRIEFATEGSMRGYGFVATDSNAILVIHPLAKQPLGTLSLPGSLPARSLSVDGRSGTVLVSDGDKLHSIRF
jgi:hypothetical protein